MTVSLTLVAIMAVMYAAGIYLLLERSLTRVLLGVLLVGNATNLLIMVVAGPPGIAPIADTDRDPSTYSDPLPQALSLTAIVITFGVSAFLLALIYRSWRLAHEDLVVDDSEDVAVRQRTAQLGEEPASESPATDFDAEGVALVEPSAHVEANRADLEAALDEAADDDDDHDFRPEGRDPS